MRGNPFGCGVALRDQGRGDIDKIVEGVLLVEQFSVVVPVATHFLSAADMRDGIHHAAIQQTDHTGIETRVHGQAIAAIGVLHQRGSAVFPEAIAVDQRYRHFHPIACFHPHTLGGVLAGVVADHRLLLELAPFAGFHIQFVRGGGRGHRGVAVTQPRRGVFGIDVDTHRIRRLIRLHVLLLATGMQQAQALKALRTLADRGETIEQLEALDIDVFAVRNPVLPLLAGCGVAWRGDDAEVLGLPVGADHPAAIQMVGAVFHVALAPGQHGERGRIACRGIAGFR